MSLPPCIGCEGLDIRNCKIFLTHFGRRGPRTHICDHTKNVLTGEIPCHLNRDLQKRGSTFSFGGNENNAAVVKPRSQAIATAVVFGRKKDKCRSSAAELVDERPHLVTRSRQHSNTSHEKRTEVIMGTVAPGIDHPPSNSSVSARATRKSCSSQALCMNTRTRPAEILPLADQTKMNALDLSSPCLVRQGQRHLESTSSAGNHASHEPCNGEERI